LLESDIEVSDADERRYVREFGQPYKEAQARVKAAINKAIASLFDLPKNDKSKTRPKSFLLNAAWTCSNPAHGHCTSRRGLQ
jgi:hypothetical protein